MWRAHWHYRFNLGKQPLLIMCTQTYPLDLIKTVLTVQVQNDGKRFGIWGCGKDIYMREGYRGLYKGWFASIVVRIKYL